MESAANILQQSLSYGSPVCILNAFAMSCQVRVVIRRLETLLLMSCGLDCMIVAPHQHISKGCNFPTGVTASLIQLLLLLSAVSRHDPQIMLMI